MSYEQDNHGDRTLSTFSYNVIDQHHLRGIDGNSVGNSQWWNVAVHLFLVPQRRLQFHGDRSVGRNILGHGNRFKRLHENRNSCGWHNRRNASGFRIFSGQCFVLWGKYRFCNSLRYRRC